MDFSKVCRTCLGTTSLNPIFKKPVDVLRYTTAIYISSGVKVEPNDGLPQSICTSCIILLNNSLKFRKQTKTTENRLFTMKNGLHEECDILDTLKDIKPNKQELDYLEINIDCAANDTDDEKQNIEDWNENVDKGHIKENNELKVKDGRTKSKISKVQSKNKSERTKCVVCRQSLSLRSVPYHMAKKHPGHDGQKRCGHCKTEYDSKELLIEHIKICTAKKKRRQREQSCKEMIECDVCKKTMQKASLKMHKAVKHAGLGPVCEHCGRRFGNKFRLNEHLRAKHGYEKFKCSFCEFQSAAAMAMRNHERRHRGEKPFVCETCGAKFHAAYLLAQHKQSHRTEKMYKCDMCPASFKANNSLHMHKTTCHSGTLYKCAMCARAYACRHYVVKHMRHVHRYSGTVPELQVLPNSVQLKTKETTKLENKLVEFTTKINKEETIAQW